MKQQTPGIDETGVGRLKTVVSACMTKRGMWHLPRQENWIGSTFGGKLISLSWDLRSRRDQNCSRESGQHQGEILGTTSLGCVVPLGGWGSPDLWSRTTKWGFGPFHLCVAPDPVFQSGSC